MKRRALLQALPAAGLLSAVPLAARTQDRQPGWRTFETTTRLEIAEPAGAVQAWVPLPLSQDTDWFQTLENTISGNFAASRIVTEPTYRASMVVARFKPGEERPILEVRSVFRTGDRHVELKPGAGMQSSPAELATYLKPTELMPTDGLVRDTALEVTKRARTDVDKARAVYDWVVENTERNPTTKGCGAGDVKAMLETKNLNGKCADLNALFVALVRAVGIPARDVYGIRVADSARGYKSLGRSGDITKAQHCRAEFYAQGIGWVPVDPADVRKVVLEEKPGLTLTDEMVKTARAELWGGWEGNWMAYNYAHEVRLPGSVRAPVPFLMYPQAENAYGRVDSLDSEGFRYQIRSLV